MEDTKDKGQERMKYIDCDECMVSKERIIRRLIWALVLSILLGFASTALSNALWLHAWMQYDYVSDETITVDGDNGTANYNYIGAGADGRITNYGEDHGKADANQD